MTQAGPSEQPTRPGRPLAPRRRAWLWTACAACLVLSYLVAWSVYSRNHLPDYTRYRQLPPGAVASSSGADIGLVGLMHSQELSVTEGRSPAGAAGAVWVVATLQVVPRSPTAHPTCSVELLGPDGRTWQEATVSAVRPLPTYCAKVTLHPGQPLRVEKIFEVPERYADQIYGVALPGDGGGQPSQVLTPR